MKGDRLEVKVRTMIKPPVNSEEQAYWPPEKFNHQEDPKSEVYSLGILAVRLLHKRCFEDHEEARRKSSRPKDIRPLLQGQINNEKLQNHINKVSNPN